jgi:hypothetical protein
MIRALRAILGSRAARGLTLIVVAATACHSSGTGRVTCDGPLRRLSSLRRYCVELIDVPDPVPLNKPFSMRVKLRPERDGRAVTFRGQLDVRAEMPEHNHGMNTVPRITRIDDSSFRVEGMNLHMPGRWRILIDVDSDGIVDQSVFEVSLE